MLWNGEKNRKNYICNANIVGENGKKEKQAGAELGQAQYKIC